MPVPSASCVRPHRAAPASGAAETEAAGGAGEGAGALLEPGAQIHPPGAGLREPAGRGGLPQCEGLAGKPEPLGNPFLGYPGLGTRLYIPETLDLALATCEPGAAPGLLPGSDFEVSEPSEFWEGHEGAGSALFEFSLCCLATF